MKRIHQIIFGACAIAIFCFGTTLIDIRQFNVTGTPSSTTYLRGDKSWSALPTAEADNTTMGIATYATNDFNSTLGQISLDYTNGQKATASVAGFLSAFDWASFNAKVDQVGITGSGLSMGTSRLLGRTTAGSGAIQEITVNAPLTFSSTSLDITGIVVADGGTGFASTTAYGLLVGGTTSTGNFQNGGTGTSGQYYKSNGNASLGTWTTPGWLIADGGTGRTTNTAYGLMAAGTTSTGAMQQVGVGLVNQVLMSGGSGALPAFSNNFGMVHKSGNVNVLATGTTALFTTDPGKGDFVVLYLSATTKTLTGSPSTTFVATVQYGATQLGTFSIIPANANAVGRNSAGTKTNGSTNVPASTVVNVIVSTAFTVATVMTIEFDVIGYYIN